MNRLGLPQGVGGWVSPTPWGKPVLLRLPTHRWLAGYLADVTGRQLN